MKRRQISGVMCRFIAVAFLLVPLLCATVSAAPVSMAIKMDYFGYRPNDTKVAIFTADPGSTVEVRDTSDNVVYTIPTDGGSITSKGFDDQPSGDNVWWVDFTSFDTAGSYRLYVPSWGEQSYDFDLAGDVYADVGTASVKSYYYQRCGVAHPETYAGVGYGDPYPCHTYLNAVTAASQEPDYGTLDLTGGWHDAGDYNKYVWGAVQNAIYHMLTAYEENPDAFSDGQLNIPESGNGVPDIIDEVKHEIDWLLKMQMTDGEVLRRVHEDSQSADPCPPSNSVTTWYYYGPDDVSRPIFTGCVAIFARICAAEGDPYGNAAELKNIAINSWENYVLPSDVETEPGYKVWAAAEIYRLDQTVTSAKNYIDTYDNPARWFNTWADLWGAGFKQYTHAAFTYIRTPGADPAVVADMKAAIGGTVDSEYFGNRDLYRNAMRSDMYFWGSNGTRCSFGWALTQAAKLGATGSHTAKECMDFAQDFLHAMHGQNPMNMVYLTNMAAYGGEHSSFQFFHEWFGRPRDPDSVAWYIGLPAGVTEPDYPYFKGVDNYGVSDDNYSDYGPASGILVGGPNKDYNGLAMPPKGETYYERVYRDWCSDAPGGWYRTKCWEVTENSIGYQGPYVGLVANFMTPPDTDPPAAPTNLTATAVSASQIDLDWDDNTESDLAGYNVYRGGEQIATGVTSSEYSDTGLSPSTQYCYTVTAVDTSSNESPESNQACATTQEAATSCHVDSITVAVVPDHGPFDRAEATVVVKDEQGGLVADATVTGTFSGDISESGCSAVTDSNGVAVVASTVTAKNVTTVTFCVDDITHATLTYNSADNVETCDSN